MFKSNYLIQREQSRRLHKASSCAVGVMVLAALMCGPTTVSAQQVTKEAARWEFGAYPAGLLQFTKGKNRQEIRFSNYALLGSVTRNFGRHWGVEGEVGGGIGIRQKQRLEAPPSGIGQVLITTPSPATLASQANVTIYPGGNALGLAPYVTAGLGVLSAFFEPSVGTPNVDTATYLTQNVGAGVKWFSGRWGVRGDYRLTRVGARDDAPELFGRSDDRYGHRVSTGITVRF